ncbi:hypothetical protein ACUXVY_12640 [Chromobacterium haemolyticum]|uniref:hypothetical protein n=1 Tax=Chromobacterium haemolyticum TaxID=394935 RepID=UPI004055A503
MNRTYGLLQWELDAIEQQAQKEIAKLFGVRPGGPQEVHYTASHIISDLAAHIRDLSCQHHKLKQDYDAQALALKAAKAMQAGETERADRAERALLRAGWTHAEGCAEWKPPLGPSAYPLLEKIDNLMTALELESAIAAAKGGAA